jgi:hypothetical protein
VNFSHPLELAQVIESWLDGALLADGARLPAGVRVVHLRRDVVRPVHPNVRVEALGRVSGLAPGGPTSAGGTGQPA